ncbi:hypothetical protein [Vreelandella venusta]|uniref:hypothetical protein n=1 Tax=Vreelandella venusta TaxID=44935 RepID=UPI00200EC0FA|nr:hypothetical protein [Halomonas venusta]UQI39249.1 hypothetical protein M3L73_13535 [Halomonas venusta]
MGFFGNVLVGIATGLISSWVVTKFARFTALRSEALRVVRRIDYIWEGSAKISGHETANADLLLIGSDLLYLGHKKAGMVLLELNQELSAALEKAESAKIAYTEFDTFYGGLQRRIRHLQPNIASLIWRLRL